ncbi:tRNA (adenosine(37)-N6)-threonylcarbamoyltransferase complex dimerization subunit type 1 TsaB [Marinilabilia rubra]|uniref:tRNA (Adenosine(37)-N6)-threonylcarbamoyltransferase complex dimerization subunit type 1 TsaB n=1 Tax=Marinilabilia rubra TaxID=2162893 RepID=A0A2U2BBV7_9BACT|nr:tRNA (adenosine(37)-N6)-threonylcarbamoyltransferase complex dimerization subunit type 1 TsaB [Marinilabilia rubra]PWE00517.1 tRNA (adenosine(37)-N6)-threonylcarbamoyltransferase complex dimerization subunit type 1 TsaB [Marinilabilia rubra]
MAYILCIETSTTVCSVALAKDGKVVAARQESEGNSHANRLTVLIQQLFEDSGVAIEITDVDAVAVSSGPGSYTGLRIGVSTAKGVCFAMDKPLISIPSLSVLAWPVVKGKLSFNPDEDSWFCPMIDARRMEVYAAMFDTNMTQQRKTSADIIDETSYRDVLDQRKVFFFGNGAGKCKEALNHPNAVFPEDEGPLARNMAALAFEAWNQKAFEDVAYFEPFYLKDFIATTPKKKVL